MSWIWSSYDLPAALFSSSVSSSSTFSKEHRQKIRMWVILAQQKDDSQIPESLNVHRRTLRNESWYVNASTGPSVICIHAFSCMQTHCRVWRLVLRWLVKKKKNSLKGYCLPALNNNNKKKHRLNGKNTIAGFETMRGAWGPLLSSAILSSVTHAARESSSSLPNTETDAPVYALSGVKCCEHHICKNDQVKAQWRRRRGVVGSGRALSEC